MTTNHRLAPVLRDRLRQLLGSRGWPRALAPRRLIAAALVLLAGALAVRPDPPPAGGAPPGVPVLVAARDLAPGTTLGAGDVRVERAPPSLRPATALESAESVTGRVLAGAATAGEPITSTRLVGPENTRLTTGGPDAVAVPVRLADAAVADLLMPGARVDVVTGDGRGTALLASDVVVITVLAPESDQAADGRLVVIAMPPEAATRVASVSLGYPVAVTLR
ncbi:MAG TPA: SAF domain-containing protein [Actinophytocola sp.]|uniref:SAF domain-containing protein n=1 Tax=Actinophytocola sp. TaxID=1872138 RepID=UPI002DBB9AAF|nr:SAF domain-containing protein [Actinophytocola sp.]HEU5475742.1 SAF domain-containing protein [Actinophytocola sp.]